MEPSTVFRKSDKGQQEVESRSRTLSLLERRVLILVDGARTTGEVAKLARVEQFPKLLQKLSRQGFVEEANSAPAAEPGPELADDGPAPAPDGASGDVNAEARDFMMNMLLTFTNRVRVAGLHSTIAEARTNDDLKGCLDDWYAAIAESPAGITEVDSLKSRLLELLLLGERAR